MVSVSRGGVNLNPPPGVAFGRRGVETPPTPGCGWEGPICVVRRTSAVLTWFPTTLRSSERTPSWHPDPPRWPRFSGQAADSGREPPVVKTWPDFLLRGQGAAPGRQPDGGGSYRPIADNEQVVGSSPGWRTKAKPRFGGIQKARQRTGSGLVEPVGLEPTASSVQGRRSPS